MLKLKADPDSVTKENLPELRQGVNTAAQPGLEAFRATGPDWQERMDAALRTALENGWLESLEE